MGVQDFEGIRKREILRAQIDSRSVGDLMEKEFRIVGEDDALDEILPIMRSARQHEIPVCSSGKRLLGVISLGALLRRKNLSVSTKAKSVLDSSPDVDPDTPITEVSEMFVATGYREIPVTTNGKVVGMITRAHVIGTIPEISDLRNVSVGEVMTHDVVTVDNDDEVEQALTLMRDLEVRSIPVMENGMVVGMLGIKDVVTYNWRREDRQTVGELVGYSQPIKLKVSSISVENVYMVKPETKLEDAVALMVENQVSSLPVVEGEKLVGIVTKYDVIELMASFRERDMVYVQITGVEEDDRQYMFDMESEIRGYLQTIAKITRPLLVNIHVSKYNSSGSTAKYSLNGRLVTERTLFRAKAVEWNLIKSTEILMDRLERMVKEHKEEIVDMRKRKGR